jgi:hypothetical protein
VGQRSLKIGIAVAHIPPHDPEAFNEQRQIGRRRIPQEVKLLRSSVRMQNTDWLLT